MACPSVAQLPVSSRCFMRHGYVGFHASVILVVQKVKEESFPMPRETQHRPNSVIVCQSTKSHGQWDAGAQEKSSTWGRGTVPLQPSWWREKTQHLTSVFESTLFTYEYLPRNVWCRLRRALERRTQAILSGLGKSESKIWVFSAVTGELHSPIIHMLKPRASKVDPI